MDYDSDEVWHGWNLTAKIRILRSIVDDQSPQQPQNCKPELTCPVEVMATVPRASPSPTLPRASPSPQLHAVTPHASKLTTLIPPKDRFLELPSIDDAMNELQFGKAAILPEDGDLGDFLFDDTHEVLEVPTTEKVCYTGKQNCLGMSKIYSNTICLFCCL